MKPSKTRVKLNLKEKLAEEYTENVFNYRLDKAFLAGFEAARNEAKKRLGVMAETEGLDRKGLNQIDIDDLGEEEV